MTAPARSRIAVRPEVSHAEMANAIRFLAIDAVETGPHLLSAEGIDEAALGHRTHAAAALRNVRDALPEVRTDVVAFRDRESVPEIVLAW